MKLQINGSEVFYGTGSGTPNDTAQTLVFVHGAGFDHTIWVMPARYFARHGWRVVALDLPGHGRSEGPPLTSIDQMADWLAQVIDAVSPDQQASVVGHSMGSLVAMNTTKSLLAKGGTTLRNFFVTTPICCPSRISYLSGRYAHNSGAIATTSAGWCSNKIFWQGPGQQVALPKVKWTLVKAEMGYSQRPPRCFLGHLGSSQ